MPRSSVQPLTICVDGHHHVSGLLHVPERARACYVLAHGAGAGITHPFLEAIAAELGERGIATLRFQFPYMEAGAKRPDSPALAQATVRAAVAEAGRRLPDLPLVAGGRSFGGRMTSQAQVAAALPNVRGLAFLAFPLHAAGRPSDERGKHLLDTQIPLLFIQGTRDALADLSLLQGTVQRLGARATLKFIHDADHAFHVPARTGRMDQDIRREIADALAAWIHGVSA